MPAKTSKESSDREKAARFVLSALLQRGQEIGNLLAELFSPHRQEGDPVPDFYGTIVAIGRKLKWAIDRVIEADHRLFAANAALDRERELREKKAKDLSRLIIGLRGACNSLFVDLSVQTLGFDARTAQDPVPLLLQAERVVASLESGELEAERLFEGDNFDPQAYVDQVEGHAAGLRLCLDRVSDLRRGAQAAVLDKSAVTEEYDRLFLHGARTFESYCRLAGKTELADRVRSTVVRSRQTEASPDEASPGEASPGETSSGEQPEGSATEPSALASTASDG